MREGQQAFENRLIAATLWVLLAGQMLLLSLHAGGLRLPWLVNSPMHWLIGKILLVGIGLTGTWLIWIHGPRRFQFTIRQWLIWIALISVVLSAYATTR